MIKFENIPDFNKLEDSQKEEILSLIKKISKKTILARREGILALEEDLCEEEDPYLKDFLQYVVDGCEESMIETIILSLYNNSSTNDFEKLRISIAGNGTLGIQVGTNPQLLALTLLSLLGPETYINDEIRKSLLN